MANSIEKREKSSTNNGTCKLVFKNYYVDSIEFKYNSNFKCDKGIAIEYELGSELEFIAQNEVKVNLVLNIFNDALENNKPFELKVLVTGFFSVDNYAEEDKVLLEQNTLAILFPYARSLVSTYTANANVAPLILPPINIVQYMKNKKEKESKKEIME